MTSMVRREKEVARLERKAKRDEREAAAGKLIDRCPDLVTLDIAIHESGPKTAPNELRYIRRVVVEHAPALFDLVCSSGRCEGGGYQLTAEILAALDTHAPKLAGQQACSGRTAEGEECGSLVRYEATATYRKAAK